MYLIDSLLREIWMYMDLEEVQTVHLWLIMGVTTALWLIPFVLGGIGLSIVAKRAGVKGKALAFLPVGQRYLMAKIAGPAQLFSLRIKRPGIWMAIFETICTLSSAFVLVMTYLIMPYYDPVLDAYHKEQIFAQSELLGNLCAFYDPVYYLSVISEMFMFIFYLIACTAFYRKYYYRNPFIFSAVGALVPYVNGFLLFAVRKNVPVDYEAFLRRQQEEYRRRYTAQQGNPPADPFSRGEGQSQSGGSTPPPDPFEDYSSAPTDPCGQSASDKAQTDDRRNTPPDPFDC